MLDSPPSDGDAVLDIGCGSGDTLLLLRNARHEALLVGVDFSDEAIRRASTNSGLLASVADAKCLPFGDETFSHVLAYGVIEHIRDSRKVFREIRRVARIGAEIHVTTSNSRSSLQYINSVRNLIKQYPYGYQKNWNKNEFANEFSNWATIERIFISQSDNDMPVVKIADLILESIFKDWGRYIYIQCRRER